MNIRLVLLLAAFEAATAAAGTWRKYEGNPVLGSERLGTCFDVNVITDGPSPYTMYFSWRPKKAIALVRSEDAMSWTQEPEICLEADPTSGWEDDLNRSCTVFKDGVWHMWYTGQANGSSKIGYAVSRDGVHFVRVRKDPVLVPEADYEKLSTMNPYVRWDAARGVWRMWYAAGETYEPNVLCYAESKDGLVWRKWSDNPIFRHGDGLVWDRDRVGACEVHPLPDGRWAMFYIGYSDIDTARIGCAISDDGITNWRRLPQNPVVSPDLGTWDSSACYKPSVVMDRENGRWLLWYNGRNGAPEYVGCALHDGLDLEAPNETAPDTRKLLSDYVRTFNARDVELYTNAVPNSSAEAFLLGNVPRFACPDKDIECAYYFRWWTFRKHLKKADGGWRVTEFLPQVGWSGTDNTIVCPAGHHFREGRWLRDPQYLTDLARFWLADPEAGHRWDYSSWLFTGTRLFADVAGLDGLPVELLDAAAAFYRRWEQGFVRTAQKLPMGGDGKGGFLSIDDREGTEMSLGGNGYKPLLSCALWSEANAIAEVARAAGRTELADEFAAKAATNLTSILSQCWNDDIGFFTTAQSDGTKGVVRELHGYAPWYFGVPTGKVADWTQLADPQGFAGRYGLTFPERRAKGFTIDCQGHECKWNGPSWPFATSIALTAYANDLHAGVRSEATARAFTSFLWQYAAAHRRCRDEKTEGDYTVVPWIDENLHPDRMEWLSRKIILDTPAMRESFPRERGKDYNHSTFCDLVISGLVGFVPEDGRGFMVDPLFPETWDYLILEDLPYRGHDVDVRWQRGKGLTVSVDGCAVARAERPERLHVALPTAPRQGVPRGCDPAVMSEAYWKIWNADEQARIDADIERNRKADARVAVDAPIGTVVSVEQVESEFRFGAHIFNFNQLGKTEWNDAYKASYGAGGLFNQATVAFYWIDYEPVPGRLRAGGEYEDTERYWNALSVDEALGERFWRRPAPGPVIDFLKSKDVAVHGHILVWGEAKPYWIYDWYCPESEKRAFDALGIPRHSSAVGQNGAADIGQVPFFKTWNLAWDRAYESVSEEEIVRRAPVFTGRMREIFRKRVFDVAGAFGNVVDSWDVVNESSHDWSVYRKSRTGLGVWKSWYGVMPGDYPLHALLDAKEAFPAQANLAINDWNVGDDFVAQVEDLVSEGAKIDLVGCQMHIFDTNDCIRLANGATDVKWVGTPQTIRSHLDTMARTDRPLHISEVTISAPGTDDRSRAIQAVLTRNIYRAWFSHPKAMGITWWNTVDGGGVRHEPLISGLFTRDMRKKPVYHALDQLINHEWKTRLSTTVDAHGQVAFRGFRGRYRLTWKNTEGKDVSKTVEVK